MRGIPGVWDAWLPAKSQISQRSQALEESGIQRVPSLVHRLCCSVGFIKPGPSMCAEAVCSKCETTGMKVSTSKSEAMVLDGKKVPCLLQVRRKFLPQVSQGHVHGLMHEGTMRLTDRLVQHLHCIEMLWVERQTSQTKQ